MKKRILVMLLLAPMLLLAQVKGKKSKKSFTTSNGTEFNVGDIVKLEKASNGNKFAYAYVSKSMLSIKNITKAVKSVRDVKNMNVSSVQNISNTLDQVNNLASSELVSGAMAQLMGQAVSESYVSENALDTSVSGKKYKIKSFKVFTDKGSGESIVHAIAKGNGKTVAILLEFAEKAGEIAK
ncbi:hypothetical protein [Polaribacter sp. Hel1_85]|uniref:hypothetical protein n=1 Tax=Polaribacter sp. Hel1_85 TaxID=1250005 RepID=UPI00052B8EC4|nr:hypothetical protein [Polaribacter sp. Hel1_85]KGL61849.1 hypothetical protein PHEL85_1634 [Polaribacter sp. Hel1_85]